MTWLLGLLTLLGLVSLAAGVFGLRRSRNPAESMRYRWLFGFSVVVLAASAFFGWPGPFGAPGMPLGSGPDVPRFELPRIDPAELALNAVGPSNRSADPRVVVVRDPAGAGADRLRLILRANDAGGPEVLKEQVRRDNWRILRTLYQDRRLARLQEIVILTTHPSGVGKPAGAAEPGDEERGTGDPAAGEPVVAEVRMTRAEFRRIGDPATADPSALDRAADVRWLPPLD